MIYVVDNDLSYSDHSVYFVESDMPPVLVDELLRIHGCGYHLIFITDVLEWREPSARTTWFGCYVTNTDAARALVLAHESDEILAKEAAIEAESVKTWPNRKMFATNELARRAAERRAP